MLQTRQNKFEYLWKLITLVGKKKKCHPAFVVRVQFYRYSCFQKLTKITKYLVLAKIKNAESITHYGENMGHQK